ncbi:hypothetical protein EON66_08810 [archaeon]|nr:MAG: hypothetical protein EON66_08810 [archaeon]
MQQISVLKAQRDLKSRELTKLVAQRRVIIEQSKVREFPSCQPPCTLHRHRVDARARERVCMI